MIFLYKFSLDQCAAGNARKNLLSRALIRLHRERALQQRRFQKFCSGCLLTSSTAIEEQPLWTVLSDKKGYKNKLKVKIMNLSISKKEHVQQHAFVQQKRSIFLIEWRFGMKSGSYTIT